MEMETDVGAPQSPLRLRQVACPFRVDEQIKEPLRFRENASLPGVRQRTLAAIQIKVVFGARDRFRRPDGLIRGGIRIVPRLLLR